jgi:hypothetical protein
MGYALENQIQSGRVKSTERNPEHSEELIEAMESHPRRAKDDCAKN